MMLLFAFLLFMGWPLGFVEPWAFSLKCHGCVTINSFYCGDITNCPEELRRCLTIAMRVNSREIIIYKNCTYNCTFVYKSEEPPEAPRRRYFRTNSFYWVRCCNTELCNSGGPTNLERDIEPDYTIEEDMEGTVRLGESTLFLSIVSILVSNTLT